MYFSRIVSAIVLATGVALVGFAYVQASGIPEAANNDFDEFVRSKGGVIMGGVGGDAFRQMSANRRVLQNVYLGTTGLLLLAAGCFGLVSSQRNWRPSSVPSQPVEPTRAAVPLPDLLHEHIARRDQFRDGSS